MYDLKQLRKLLNQNVIIFYKSICFRQLNEDSSSLIWQTKKEISIVNVYIDNFLLASNTMRAFKILKKLLVREYKMKDFGEVRIIISWQITRDTVACTIKIDLSAFIRDLIIKEGLTEWNTNVIPIKARSAIEIFKLNNYKKTKL